MPRFRQGDRVYLRDGASGAPDNRPQARLATIVSEIDDAGAASYVVSIPDGEPANNASATPVPENLMEPGGEIAERYEQILGPFTDYETMLKQAVSINQ